MKKMLGLDISEKTSDYMGWPLYSYLKAEGYALAYRNVEEQGGAEKSW